MHALKPASAQEGEGNAARIDKVATRLMAVQIDAVCQRKRQGHHKQGSHVDKTWILAHNAFSEAHLKPENCIQKL
jgi:hypothetical protein